MILVRSGSLRLYMMSEEGKDITLYRLQGGELCMLSASCLLGEAITFDVFVDAEEESICYVINGAVFAAIAERSPDMKIFALETVVSRFSDVMWVMQQILFMSMDKMKELHAEEIPGVVHCYSYSPELAREYVKMGYYIGVGGVVTFKNAIRRISPGACRRATPAA